MTNKTGVPQHLVDPTTKILFRNPVSTPTGMVFDRGFITGWLNQTPTCPISKKPLHVDELEPCPLMTQLVNKYLKTKPMTWMDAVSGDHVLGVLSTQCLGRSVVFEQLKSWIIPNNVIAIEGADGIGKTYLIDHVVEALKSDNQLDDFDMIITHSFDAFARIDDAVFRIMKSLIDEGDLFSGSSDDILEIWTSNIDDLEKSKSWRSTSQVNATISDVKQLSVIKPLIILKGVEKAISIGETFTLDTLRRKFAGACIIFESNQDVALNNIEKTIRLQPLEPEAQYALCSQAHSAYNHEKINDKDIQTLCHAIGGSPIRILFATGYMAYHNQRVSEYVALFRKRKRQPNLETLNDCEITQADIIRQSMQVLNYTDRQIIGLLATLAFDAVDESDLRRLLYVFIDKRVVDDCFQKSVWLNILTCVEGTIRFSHYCVYEYANMHHSPSVDDRMICQMISLFKGYLGSNSRFYRFESHIDRLIEMKRPESFMFFCMMFMINISVS